MHKPYMLTAAVFGGILFAGAANAGPLSATGALNSTASRAAIDQALPDAGVQDVHWWRHERRHWSWYRGHHYGWRHHYRGPRYGYYYPYPHRRVYYW